MKSYRLLVIAGAVVQPMEDGNFCTKNPIADYLNELGESFGATTWVANRYQGTDYRGVIDTNRVKVVVVENGWRGRLRSWVAVFRLALASDYVLYYLPNHYLPIFPLMRLRAKRIAVYLAGDYEANIKWFADKRWPGWPRLFRWSFEYPMRHADALIARGRMLADVASRFNKCVHETIPLGHMKVDGYHIAKNKQDNEGYAQSRNVLYVGKVTETKGIRHLFRAFMRMLQRTPGADIRLHVVGDGDGQKSMEILAKELSIDGNVIFYGWVSDGAEIDKLFNHAHVLIVPSVYPEGVPRVIDEAIIRGVPVIATSVGGIPQEYPNGEVMIVPPKDSDALSLALDRMLFQRDTRDTILARAEIRRKHLCRYSSAAAQHIEILLNLKDKEKL